MGTWCWLGISINESGSIASETPEYRQYTYTYYHHHIIVLFCMYVHTTNTVDGSTKSSSCWTQTIRQRKSSLLHVSLHEGTRTIWCVVVLWLTFALWTVHPPPQDQREWSSEISDEDQHQDAAQQIQDHLQREHSCHELFALWSGVVFDPSFQKHFCFHSPPSPPPPFSLYFLSLSFSVSSQSFVSSCECLLSILRQTVHFLVIFAILG